MNTLTEDLLTARDVVDQTGVSYRQLDYWARAGALVPRIPAAGSGSVRRYDTTQVAIVRFARALAALCPTSTATGGPALTPVAVVRRAVEQIVADRCCLSCPSCTSTSRRAGSTRSPASGCASRRRHGSEHAH